MGSLHLWLLGVFNSIVEMEEIPPMLKSGLLSPVYKGGGRDPFLTTNYRGGITVNSVLSKLLGTLILSRMEESLPRLVFHI